MKTIILNIGLFFAAISANACPDSRFTGEYICQGKNDSKVQVTLQRLSDTEFNTEENANLKIGETQSTSRMGMTISVTGLCEDSSLVVNTNITNSSNQALIGGYTKKYTVLSDSELLINITTRQASGTGGTVEVNCKKIQ